MYTAPEDLVNAPWMKLAESGENDALGRPAIPAPWWITQQLD